MPVRWFSSFLSLRHCPSVISRSTHLPASSVLFPLALYPRSFTSFSQTTMFAAPRDSSPRQRSASRSTDDHSSTKDKPRRLLHRYVHDPSMPSQPSATTNSHYDDTPTPSIPHSTPMTSPSTGYTSLFPGSLSSTTSESVPSAESKYQSEFGLLTPSSPLHGSASSASSHPVSRSTTESDSQASAPRMPRRYPSGHFSHRPSTAPHPVSTAASNTDSSAVDHHTRSQSRLTVSIKNLLSKSVVTSPSRFSFNSSTPSDSEASSRSFHVLAAPGKWPMTQRKSRPPDLEISNSVPPPLPSPGRTSNPPTDVHRRYASEAVAKLYNARTGSGPLTSQESLDAPVRNVPVRGREPKTRNVLRRRPSGSAKLFKGRERGMSSPSSPRQGDADRLRLPPKEGMSPQGGMLFPLTAAGAVAEAYKQQELHHNHTPSSPQLSIYDRMHSSHDGRYERDHLEHSPTPYYTVFGSSSGRVMQAGGPDDRWSRFEADQAASQAASLHQPSISDPGGRSITRKVSSRWRKVKGGVISEESSSRDRGHSKGRSSLQELWGGDKPGTRSMDGVPNARDGAWASPMEGYVRSGSERTDGSEGGKLWRLMRRISTGGLRDRFQSDKGVPPVPAIPKELLEKVNQGERGNSPLSPSRHQPSSSLQDKDHTRTFTPPKNIAVVRPNADFTSAQFYRSARSSVSSYGEAVGVPPIPEIVLDRRIITPLEQLRLADNQVERGEPCMSSVPVPRSPRRSTSVPVGLRTIEDAEGELAPLPSPRRQTCAGESHSSCSSRPSSTSASISGSVRASYQGRGHGLGRSRMEDGIVSLSPPPRPARNSRRGEVVSIESSPSHSMVARQVEGDVGVIRQMDRVPSSRSDMTARRESPEPGPSRGRGDEEDQDGSRTQLTFRELAAPRRPPLSEREKADIWNDLLARSDKAGGTLHINGAAELMSDSMRFSTHSGMS